MRRGRRREARQADPQRARPGAGGTGAGGRDWCGRARRCRRVRGWRRCSSAAPGSASGYAYDLRLSRGAWSWVPLVAGVAGRADPCLARARRTVPPGSWRWCPRPSSRARAWRSPMGWSTSSETPAVGRRAVAVRLGPRRAPGPCRRCCLRSCPCSRYSWRRRFRMVQALTRSCRRRGWRVWRRVLRLLGSVGSRSGCRCSSAGAAALRASRPPLRERRLGARGDRRRCDRRRLARRRPPRRPVGEGDPASDEVTGPPRRTKEPRGRSGEALHPGRSGGKVSRPRSGRPRSRSRAGASRS